jgi:hypothetical protein
MFTSVTDVKQNDIYKQSGNSPSFDGISSGRIFSKYDTKDKVTGHGVWIGNWIKWSLIICDYVLLVYALYSS